VVILVVGVVINIAAGAVYSITYPHESETVRRKLAVASAFCMIPLLVSFMFLFDAFRRFRKINKSERVINNC
jgi:hypothetical protein